MADRRGSGSNGGQMIMGGRARRYRPHKYWGKCGAEGIRTPDPLDANEVRYRTAPQPQTVVQGIRAGLTR